MYLYTIVFEVSKENSDPLEGTFTNPRTEKTVSHEKIAAKDDDEAQTVAEEKAESRTRGSVRYKVLRIFKERYELPRKRRS